jgi:hypothetical protein
LIKQTVPVPATVIQQKVNLIAVTVQPTKSLDQIEVPPAKSKENVVNNISVTAQPAMEMLGNSISA